MIKLTEKNGKHFYTSDTGRLPSSTTILAELNKPALIDWAARETSNYILNNIETSNKSEFKKDEIIETVNKASKQHQYIKKKAAEIGSNVHKLIENYIKNQIQNKIINLTEEKKYPAAFDAFIKWEKDFEAIHSYTEFRVISKLWGGYAGTLDLISEIDNKIFLVDLKTSNAIYDEFIMQLASYRNAYQEMTGNKIYSMGILRLDKNELKYEWKVYNKKEYIRALKMFGHLCRYWHLKYDKI
jgi:hypothetical protein